MTAAYRLRGLGWFGSCVVVTLAFYLVSLQVATERKKLEALDAKIASTERDIRALETEFDTRGNLAQLERWNGDTLALSAPQAAQFVRSEAQLAQISFAPGTTAPGSAEVRTAQLIVPAAPTPAVTPVATPIPDPAAPRERTLPPVTVAAAVAKPQPAPTLQKVAFATVAAKPAIHPAVAMRIRGETAMLDRKLLSDSTLGDLLSGARSEKTRR